MDVALAEPLFDNSQDSACEDGEIHICEWYEDNFRWPFGFLGRFRWRHPWLLGLPIIARRITCTNAGMTCVPPSASWAAPEDASEWEAVYYCGDHIARAGFCWGCGQFWAGVESFDFSRNGLCDNCKDDPDWGDSDDEYDPWLVYGQENE